MWPHRVGVQWLRSYYKIGLKFKSLGWRCDNNSALGLLAKIISVLTQFLVAIVYDLNLVNLAHPFYQ